MSHVTKKELAARWGISIRQIENLVNSGELPRPKKTPRAEAEPGKRRLLRWTENEISVIENKEQEHFKN